MTDEGKQLGGKIGSYLAIAVAGIMVFFLIICLEGYESGHAIYVSSHSHSAQNISTNSGAIGYMKYLYALCWIEGACLFLLLNIRRWRRIARQ